MTSRNICVAITNYDFSDNADALYRYFSSEFPTILIDASSPMPPSCEHLSIENTYYPGLWNSAVKYAKDHQFEWLLFIASDVLIENTKRLCENAREASSYDSIGIYSPSVSPDSRCAFKTLFNRATSVIRECGVHEGFIFMARTDILSTLYPLGPERKFGWGVDVACSLEANRREKLVVVDDRVMVFHPKSKAEHAISVQSALRELQSLSEPGQIEYANRIQNELLQKKIVAINRTSSLDIGCGPNPRNNFNANSVHGIDIRENSEKNVKFADLNIDPIPYEESSFEYVTATDFLEHVARLIYIPHRRFPFIELMNEIYRVLKPGGILLSVTPAYPDAKAFQDPTHVNFITEETFKSYFCQPQYWARMYGFSGKFRMLNQRWDDGKLITLMRALK
jgi:predicted SAM-dependent methyltransferase